MIEVPVLLIVVLSWGWVGLIILAMIFSLGMTQQKKK